MKLTANDKQDIPYITVVSYCSFVFGGFWVKISVLTIHSPSRHITLHESMSTLFHTFFQIISSNHPTTEHHITYTADILLSNNRNVLCQ